MMMDKKKYIYVNLRVERDEWEKLDNNINVSRNEFLRDYIRRFNSLGSDLDKLYDDLICKRNDCFSLTMDIMDIKMRINELEELAARRDVTITH